MTVTALELDRGVFHGRIPATYIPHHGAYVFELGHLNRIAEAFEHGDRIELTQNIAANFATEKLLRCIVKLKAPTISTVGATWIFTVRYGVFTYYTRRIHADGKELTLSHIGVPLINAPQMLVFRLQLEVV